MRNQAETLNWLIAVLQVTEVLSQYIRHIDTMGRLTTKLVRVERIIDVFHLCAFDIWCIELQLISVRTIHRKISWIPSDSWSKMHFQLWVIVSTCHNYTHNVVSIRLRPCWCHNTKCAKPPSNATEIVIVDTDVITFCLYVQKGFAFFSSSFRFQCRSIQEVSRTIAAIANAVHSEVCVGAAFHLGAVFRCVRVRVRVCCSILMQTFSTLRTHFPTLKNKKQFCALFLHICRIACNNTGLHVRSYLRLAFHRREFTLLVPVRVQWTHFIQILYCTVAKWMNDSQLLPPSSSRRWILASSFCSSQSCWLIASSSQKIATPHSACRSPAINLIHHHRPEASDYY